MSGSNRGLVGLLLRGAGGTLFLRGISVVIGFTSGIVLARLLGAEQFGIYGYALTWANLLTVVASLRANVLVVREVSRLQTKSRWGLFRGLLRSMDLTVLVSSIVVAVIAGVLGSQFADQNPSIDRTTFALAMMLLPITGLALLRQARLEGLQRVVSGQWPEILGRQGSFLVLVALVYFFGSQGLSTSDQAMALQVGAAAFALCLLLLLGRRALPREVTNATHETDHPTWFASLRPLLLVGILTSVNRQADTVMLGMLRSAEDVGVYAVVLRLSSLLSYVLVAANVALGPVIARLYATGEIEQLQRTLSRSSAAVFVVSLPPALVLLFAGEWVLALFGPEFTAGGTALQWAAGAQLFNTIAGSVGITLLMTGHERVVTIGVGVAAVLNIGLNLWLIPELGIEGAAIATTVSTVVWNVVLLALLGKHVGVHSTAFRFWR